MPKMRVLLVQTMARIQHAPVAWTGLAAWPLNGVLGATGMDRWVRVHVLTFIGHRVAQMVKIYACAPKQFNFMLPYNLHRLQLCPCMKV